MKIIKKPILKVLNIQYLVLLIFLILQANFLNAQNFETALRQAAKDLANPIYAIIEMPQPDGTVEYISIKKNETEKINLLEDNYQWIRSEILTINKSIFYKKVENNESKYIQATLAKNCKLDTNLVIIKAPSTRIEVVPAQYITAKKRVLAKTYSPKLITIPAKYKTVSDTILIKSADTIFIDSPPPEYKKITEIVEISPATTRWIKRKAPYVRCCGSFEDCQVWVMVEVPARYASITGTVMTFKPPCTNRITIPAEYEIIKKTVLVEPATIKEVKYKPEYTTVTTRVVTVPACVKTIDIPAEYKTTIQTSFKDRSKVVRLDVPYDYNKEGDQNINIKTTDIIRHYQPKAESISIFPNPATDKITIQSKENIEQILIFDAQGHVVFSHFYKNKNTVQLEISDFNNGFYSIQVKTNVNLQTLKIIKQ
jgi:hypothetical protein